MGGIKKRKKKEKKEKKKKKKKKKKRMKSFLMMIVALAFTLVFLSTSAFADGGTIGWPSTDGSAISGVLPGASITIFGSNFITTESGNYVLYNPDPIATAFSVTSNTLVFRFTSDKLPALGDIQMFIIVYAATSTTVGIIPVMRSEQSYSMPLNVKNTIQTAVTGAGITGQTITLLLKRIDQDFVHLEMKPEFVFTYSGTTSQVGTVTPIPQEYRPRRTERCFAHTTVAGIPKDIHVDIQTDGILKFASAPAGTGWTTSGASYFNGCSWLAA